MDEAVGRNRGDIVMNVETKKSKELINESNGMTITKILNTVLCHISDTLTVCIHTR